MKAAIRGTEIYYDIAGMQIAPTQKGFETRPVLFMLHGGPGGDHLRFKQHSLELQDVAQLVFIDHRGCGRSKKTHAREYTLENNIEDIEALRKHLGLDKICILGTSYGGIVAQGYALRYPQHIDKLILAATAPSYRFMKEAQAHLKKHGNKKQNVIAEHLWKGTFKNPNHVKKFFVAMDTVYSTKAKPKSKASYARSTTVWSHDALNMGFGGFLRTYDYIPKLSKIKAPTLILGGEKDWICSAAQSRTIAQHIKHAKLKIFKNSGHAIAVDAHKEYINNIQQFLKAKPTKKRSKRK